MNSEMKSAKWLWGGIGLQFATGFTVSYLVYQIGTLVVTGSVGNGFVPGLVAIAAFVLIVVVLVARTNKRLREEKLQKRSKTA